MGAPDEQEQQDIENPAAGSRGDEEALKESQEIRIVPDTSWLVALLDEKDAHHVAAESSFGAVLPYKPVFYIPAIAYMETASRLIRVGKMSVKKCFELMDKKFLHRINYKHSTKLAIKDVVEKYKKFSRVKIKSLHPVDFHIATEGILLGAKILTCDLKMYEYVAKYYKEIYFVVDNAKKQKSGLGDLLQQFKLKK